jgi:hypothetical protein
MTEHMTSQEITNLAAQLVAEIHSKTNTPAEDMLIASMIQNLMNTTTSHAYLERQKGDEKK